MIASFARNFIFIKTVKTAGTSIEIALSRYCGRNDILTPIVPRDERMRIVDGVVAARNFAPFDPRIELGFRRAMMMRDDVAARTIVDSLRPSGRHFFNHMTADQARAMLPSDFWSSALKFTVVRHPYERMVSAIYFRGGGDVTPAQFDDYFDKLIPVVAEDLSRYTHDGTLVVDDLIRHETLLVDYNRILARLHLEPVTELPRAKGTQRRDRRPAREILSRPQKRRVKAACAREFEIFGYES